jgi:hypothetical protein
VCPLHVKLSDTEHTHTRVISLAMWSYTELSFKITRYIAFKLSLKRWALIFGPYIIPKRCHTAFVCKVLLLSLVSINKLLTTKAYGCFKYWGRQGYLLIILNHLFPPSFKSTSKCVIYGRSIKMCCDKHAVSQVFTLVEKVSVFGFVWKFTVYPLISIIV